MKFFHVTSPVKVSKNRDLFYAQPVTFESFKRAKNFSDPSFSIEQCTVQFEEDLEIVPGDIRILDNLTHSLLDVGNYSYKFPFIKEILDITYSSSVGFDYLIYSNVDIALMPYFYNSLFELIKKGNDAIIVNRRSITDKYKSKKDINLMWAEIGETHPGWDCFVFKRNLYPQFVLENAVIGAVGIGRILFYNLQFFSNQFTELKNSHLTFHLGYSPTTTRQYSDKNWIKANIYNDEQLKKILNSMIDIPGGRNAQWAYQELKALEKRRKKYNEVLNGARRFPGYWKVKKLISFLKDSVI